MKSKFFSYLPMQILADVCVYREDDYDHAVRWVSTVRPHLKDSEAIERNMTETEDRIRKESSRSTPRCKSSKKSRARGWGG